MTTTFRVTAYHLFNPADLITGDTHMGKPLGRIVELKEYIVFAENIDDVYRVMRRGFPDGVVITKCTASEAKLPDPIKPVHGTGRWEATPEAVTIKAEH